MWDNWNTIGATNYFTSWDGMHTSATVIDWSLFDAYVALCVSKGVTDILYTFGYTPTWARADGNRALPPTNLAHWDYFVSAVMTRAAATGINWAFGVWNEPNAFPQSSGFFWQDTPAALAAMGQRLYDIRNSVFPTALIVSPETQGNGSGWMSEYMAAAGGQNWDILGVHLYGGSSAYISEIASYFPGYRALTAKPIWNTEFGHETFHGGTLVTYMTTMVAKYRELGIERCYWYAYDAPTGRLANPPTEITTAMNAYRSVMNSAPPLPPMVLVDIDLDGDPDDASFLKVTHALADNGELRIGLVAANSGNPHTAVVAEIINTYCGRPIGVLPICAYQGTAHAIAVGSGMGNFCDNVVAAYAGSGIYASISPSKTRTAYNTPLTNVQRMRTFLAAQPDGSVTWLSGGFFNNIADLMLSPADSISSLTGLQLFAAKVNRLIATLILSQSMPSNDYNTGADQLASDSFAYVAANIPPAIEFDIIDCDPSQVFQITPSGTNPIKACYDACTPPQVSRAGLDQETGLLLCRPSLFTKSHSNGTASRTSSSFPWPSNWTAGGSHGNTSIWRAISLSTNQGIVQGLQDQTPGAGSHFS